MTSLATGHCAPGICSEARVGFPPPPRRPPLPQENRIQGRSRARFPEHTCMHTEIHLQSAPTRDDSSPRGSCRAGGRSAPRPLAGPRLPSRSISNTLAASSGVRQRNSLAGSVWRRGRPGVSGIPGRRSEASGSRPCALCVAILAAGASLGCPNLRSGLRRLKGPSSTYRRGVRVRGTALISNRGRPGGGCTLPLL